MRLLLLEDDPILGDGLRDFLHADGHAVDWFPSLRQAQASCGEPYDAYLVDWQLPDGSGLDWVRSLRLAGSAMPMILMTARDLLSDRVRGLDSGADDYLVKPFDPEELGARLRALRRRLGGAAHARLRFREVDIDLTARCAFVGGVRCRLTAREWNLTVALATRAGRIVSRNDLDALVFAEDGELASNSLEVHISSIRRKLGKSLIETVRGLGYRIAA